MIETGLGFDARVKVQQIIENQLPEFILDESPKFSEFLKQYYISQEFQGGPSDLAENLDQYIKLDNLTPEVIRGSTSLTYDISSTVGVITVTSTKGFPSEYGLIKIDDEVITYTGVTTNTFTGCLRGFSGITSYRHPGDPTELVFSDTVASSHSNSSSVENLSSLFLKEFYKKLKFTLTPGLEDVDFVSNLDVSNFIKQAKSFYQSKGTEESFRILFNILYGEDPKVIDLEDYLIKPSSADFSRRKIIIVERISGDPLNLVGQTIKRTNNTKTQASVSEAEILTRRNRTYYKLSLFVGFNDAEDISEGQFVISGKSKVLENTPIGSSIISVDSTIGFNEAGSLICGNNIINYTSKSVNQFFGCSGIVSPINATDDIRSNETIFGYENGDLTKLVEMRITGVLSEFVPINDILVANEQEVIRVKNLGEIIQNPLANKTYTETFANTWIYNTSSRYQVSNISGSTFTLLSTIDRSSLKLGDNVEVLVRGGQNVVSSNAIVANINNSNNQIILNNLGGFTPSPGFSYDIRRKIRKATSSGAQLEYGNDLILNDIQNVYTENDEYAYVAANSIPGYNLTKDIVKSSISSASPPRLQDYNVLTERYSIISFSSNVEFITGDAVIYEFETSPMPGLSSEEIYYVEVLNQPNQIRLYSTRAFIGGDNYVTFGGVSSAGSHTFILEEHRKKIIGAQKLLRKFPLEQNFDINVGEETISGPVGMLINGVEIINSKTNNKIFYGPIESSVILNSGTGYDVINPPDISVSIPTAGIAASIVPVVSGSVNFVYVDPQDFDIDDVVSVTVTGGNGNGCILQPVISKRNREVEFDGRRSLFGGGVDITNETITFLSVHNFQNGEEIVYNPNGNPNLGIGTFGPPDIFLNKATGLTLITGASYYAKVINPKTIQVYPTFNDYFVGLNTVGFTTENSGGIHKFRTLSKKTLKGVKVINPGSGYENRRLFVKPVGISTIENTITFKNHNFKEGDLVKYYSTGTAISGLTTTNQYYIIKIDSDNFKLSDAGSDIIPSRLNFERKKVVSLGSSTGSGYHVFKYPDIQTFVNVSYGSTLVGIITATPRITGSIIDTYLIESGTGYGSSILNLEKKPTIVIKNGIGAEVNPIVRDGKIIKVDVLTGGSEYVSAPDLVINGPGSGAILRPVISNQRLEKVIVINSGIGYDEDLTTITVKSAGSGFLLDTRIRSLTLNNAYRFGSEILLDSEQNNLQYGMVGYSTALGSLYFGDSGLEHSPIIGWSYDGCPIYGPWGYSDPEDNNSPVRTLLPGYVLDTTNVYNRPVSFPSGFFVEDYKFNDSGDLDVHNGRFCKTPDFQNGVYAYFVGVSTDLTTNTLKSAFPYFIGDTYRNNLITENLLLNQSFDFNNSSLVRNTFPYKVNDLYADNDFLIESNEIINQLSVIESTRKGSVDSLNILESGEGYKIGDLAVFDNTETNGGGITASVSEITGKEVERIDTTVLEYANSAFVWKDSNTVIAKVNDYHDISTNNNIVVSGLSTSISKLFGIHNVGVTSTTSLLFKSMPSNVVVGFVTDIFVSSIPSNVSAGSSIQIENEILQVLNIYRDNSILRVKRSDVGAAHTLSTLVSYLPNEISIPLKVNYFDSKFNNKIYFNPRESVGVGTTTGYSNTISFTVGEIPRQISVPTQNIYIPNHPFKTGDSVTLTKKTTTFPLIVGMSPSGSTFNLPFTTNTEEIYVINKGKDYIGLATVNTGISSSSGLYFFNNGSDNYEYLLENNYNQVTGTIQKITTLVSLSTSHGMLKDDVVKLDVKSNLSVGIGTSTSVRLVYDSGYNKLLANPVGFDSSNINVSNNVININNHGLKTGDKVFYNSSDLIASGLNTGGYFVYKLDDNNIQLGETSIDVSSSYPNIVNIIGVGGSSHQLSVINPEISIVRNNNLVFDLSDTSLFGYKLKVFYDQEFTNEFISIRTQDTFNVTSEGTIGIGSTATLTLNYSDDLPSKLYYNIELNGNLVDLDEEVNNYGQLTYINSRYNQEYSIISTGTTTFVISPTVEPERLTYRQVDCDSLEYTTKSLTASGGVANMNLLFGGSAYKFLPKFVDIQSDNGRDVDIVAVSTSIGKLNQVRILDQGFEYSSDKTLRPEAYISPIINIEKSNFIQSVEVTDGGKNYASPPDLILFDPSTNTVVDSDSLSCSIFSSSIAKVDIISDINGLNSITHRVISINNSNGVAISSVTSSPSGIVTCTLSTPVLSGFITPPFAVGDEIFVEGIAKQGTDGTGFNSSDYNYQFFKVSSYTNSNPAKLEFDLSDLTINPGIAKSDQSAFAFIVNKKNYPTFNAIQDFAIFNIGEKILSDTGVGFFERDLLVIDSKKEYVKVSGNYVLQPGEKIKGKFSGVNATVSSVVNNRGRFDIGFAIERDFGWNNDIGKLNQDYQVVPDNDYYQNLSYSVKSSIEYQEMINPVNSLLHTTGLKNFADTQVSSAASVTYGAETKDLIILDVIEEKRVDTINNFDLVVDVDVEGNKSKYLKTKNRKLVDYIKCISNNVLLVDDVSQEFSNRDSIIDLYTDIKKLDDSYYRFLVQIVDPVTNNIEFTELILLATDKDVFTLQKGTVSTTNSSFGELIGSIDSFDTKSLRFTPEDPFNIDYNIKLLENSFNSSVSGLNTSNIGFISLTGSNVNVGVGSTARLYTKDIDTIEAISANIQIINKVTNKTSYVELFVEHDGQDTYIAEYYFDNIAGITTSFMGSFTPSIESNNLCLDYYNEESNELFIRSKIVGIGTTGAGTANYRYLVPGQIAGNERSAYYNSNYTISSSPETIITCNNDHTGSIKSLVRVSYGETSAIHQLITLINGVDSYINQYPYVSIAATSGIGTFGVEYSGSNANLKFYPDNGISTPIKVQSYNEVLYTENDNFNLAPELQYGPVSEIITLSSYESVNGTRINKLDFGLTYEGTPIFAKTFNPSSTSVLDKETGIFTIKNHFFRNGERLIYTPKSTFIGIAATSVGIGATLNSVGVVTNILPRELYAIELGNDQFRVATRKDYASAGIYVTFTNSGSGNAHQFEMYKKNEKSIISINGVVQKPITYTPVSHTLLHNPSGNIGASSTIFSLSGISSIRPTDLLKIDEEYMGVIAVGFGSTGNGPITGIGTYQLVTVSRGFVGSGIASHTDGTEVRIYRGSYNIVENQLYFTEPPKGRGVIKIDNTNIAYPASAFDARVYLRNDYSENVIYDDISDQFTGIGQSFRLTVGGANTSVFEQGSGVLFINDVFQTPSTLNNSGNNYEITESVGVTSVTFTGITSVNGSLIKSDVDINQNALPRGGIIVSLGSTQGLGFAPLVGASVTAVVNPITGSIVSVGLGTTDIIGSGYNNIPTILVYEEGHAGVGSTATITASVGAGGTLSFTVGYGGTGYSNPKIQIPDPSYENLPVIGISRRGIGNTTDTGTGLLVTLKVGPADLRVVSGRNADASNLITRNKVLIAEVAVGRMLDAFPGFSVPGGNQNCIDDIIDVLEAISYNIKYGGNDQVYDAAKIYIDNAYLAGEETESIYAFEQARDMAIQAMRNEAITINNYSIIPQYFDNEVEGDISGLPGVYNPGDCADVASAITSSVGIVTNAIGLSILPANRTVSVASSLFQVSSFNISRPGYAFKVGDVFKPVGLVTARHLATPIEDFQLTVLDTFTDSFSLWQFGELDYIDSVRELQDGERVRFPLFYNGELLSFEKDPLDAKSTLIDLDSVLIIFVNGVLQTPKEAYTFEGGTSFTFTDPPREEDNVSIFFYRGTRGVDSKEEEILETIKIGDDVQVLRNNLNLANTVDQEIRRIDDIVGSDKVETNIYSGAGIDANNFKPLSWTKQKVDKIIKGDPVYKVRDSIEPLIYPTARVIKTINSGDSDIFVDDAKFFEYEQGALSVTIPEFSGLLIQGTNVVAAGVSAIVSAAGTISGFTINEQGNGYTGASVTIKIAPPPNIGVGIGTTATATISVSGGKISAPISITNAGFGYTTSNPPQCIIEDPDFKYELITEINAVEGFSGIVTGIGTTTGVGGHGLALKFFARSDFFTGLSVGYPIYIFDTSVGHGVTSVINSNSDVIGIGTTALNNIYYVGSISAAGQNAEIVCNVHTNLRRTGITTSGSIETPVGRFSWGRFSLFERSTINPIAIGVSGLTIDAGLSTFPIFQRRGYGLRDTGALRKI